MWEEGHPILGAVYFRRGAAHQYLGHIELARADYEMVIKLKIRGEIGREAETRLRVIAPHH